MSFDSGLDFSDRSEKPLVFPTRWSMGGKSPILGHQRFQTLMTEFVHAVEHCFNTPCVTDITVMSKNKVTSTYMLDDWMQESINEENQSNILMMTQNITDITERDWNMARYVEAVIKPIDPDKATSSVSWAHAEFLGNLPDTANFYVQGGDHDCAIVKERMIGYNPAMRIGDGYQSNSQDSFMVPSSVAPIPGTAEICAITVEKEQQRAEKAEKTYGLGPIGRALRYVLG